MSRTTHLFAFIILSGMLLSGCNGKTASSYMQSYETEESSLKTQEQLVNPYLVTISQKELAKRFYGTYCINICWLSENELLVQGVEGANSNYKSVLSTTNINMWQPNAILEEENLGYLTDVVKIKDNIYATKINGDCVIFDKNYNVLQTKYFDVPDDLAAIFNPVNNTLYYYENGGMYAEDPSGKGLIYPLPSQWQERAYIRAVTLSASGDKLAFSIIIEPAYSVLTVVLNTKTGKYNEIDIEMNMPSYFWMGEELFAIANVDAEQSYCNIYYGENLSQVKIIDRAFLTQELGLTLLPEEDGDWGYIAYNTTQENLGGNAFDIPLEADYRVKVDKRESALLLLQKKNDEVTISLLEHGDEMYAELIVSPEGKKILFRKWGDKNKPSAYYVLPLN